MDRVALPAPATSAQRVGPTGALPAQRGPGSPNGDCDIPIAGRPLPLDVDGTTDGSGPNGRGVPPLGADLSHPSPLHGVTTGAGVVVAIIDTGASVPGVSGDRDSCLLHGTATASVVRALAPGASVRSYRVAPASSGRERGTDSAAQAINRAVEDGARVINVSLVSCAPSRPLEEAIHRAEAQGRLVVAAIGNTGQCDPAVAPMPASLPTVLGVGAVDARAGASLEDANAGRVPAAYNLAGVVAGIYAPGGPVSAQLDGQAGPQTIVGNPQPFVGTSFAAPVVSGTASLMASVAPELQPAQMREILLSTAIPGGRSDHATAGTGAPVAGAGALSTAEAAPATVPMAGPADGAAVLAPAAPGHIRVLNPTAAVSAAVDAHARLRPGDPAAHASGPLVTHATVLADQGAAGPVEAAAVPVADPDYTLGALTAAAVALASIAAVIARARGPLRKPPSASGATTRHGTWRGSSNPRAATSSALPTWKR